jgi:hypothetical protein
VLGDVRDRRLGTLRQRDPDAVARTDPEPAQGIREPVRLGGQLAEGDPPQHLPSVRDEDRGRIARLALADDDAEVDVRRDAPAEAPVELVVPRHTRRRSSSAT